MKIPGYKNGLWLVLLLSVLHSCTIEKRLYRPGYFTSWNKKQKSESIAIHTVQAEQKDAADPAVANGNEVPVNPDGICVSPDQGRNAAAQPVLPRTKIVKKAEPRPHPVLQKKTVAPEDPVPDDKKVTNRYSTLALGFAILAVAALLSLFIFHAGIFVLAAIFAPMAFIFGLIALRQIRREPEKYKHKWYAWAGVAVGIPLFLFMVILIVEFVRYFFFI